MTLTEPSARERRFVVEWLFLLGALLALAGYIGYLQYREYQQIETQERERLTTQAAVIEKNVTPQLLLANRVIDGIVNELPFWQAENDGFKHANRQLQVIDNAMIGIRPILVIQADGKVVASSNEKLIGMNFSRREYFQTALKHSDPGILHVSAPFKTVLDTFVFSLFRTIAGPNGEFAGIVIVSVVPEYFSVLLDSVRYAPDMRTSIAHGDGKVFLTAPQNSEIDGMNLAIPGSLFTRHRDSGQPANVFTGPVFATGDERMMVLRTIQLTTPPMDKPLVVAVSRNLDAIFSPWRKRLYVQSILLGVIMVFSTIGLLIAHRRWRNQLTERKQTADRINDLLQEQRLIFDNAHVGIVMLRQRQVVKCNQRLAEMFGYAGPEEIECETLEKLFSSPEEFTEVGKRLYAMMMRQGFAQGEEEMRRQDGKHIWVMLTGRPLDTSAVHDGSIWVYTDITDRVHAETEQRIAATAFASQESLMITDADSVILRVNSAFTETTGYTSAEAVGQTPRLLKSGRHDADFYRAMWETIHRTGMWQGEILDRRKDGEVYPKWLTISAVKRKDGIVTNYVGSHFDISERKVAEEIIKKLAFYDPLTGLPNRRLLMDRLQQAFAASARSGREGALLFIDLDNFKAINDTFGHDIGDLLLQQTAQRLLSCMREGDTVARLGGDEFVVMLEELSKQAQEAVMQAQVVSEKILAALNENYQLAAHRCHCTPSIGAAIFSDHHQSPEELLKRADVAMYQAKKAGRNTLRFFNLEMHDPVTPAQAASPVGEAQPLTTSCTKRNLSPSTADSEN